ncbi:MAG: hypothetical protein RLN99_09220, partial [Kiloniellaceae bacterium]
VGRESRPGGQFSDFHIRPSFVTMPGMLGVRAYSKSSADPAAGQARRRARDSEDARVKGVRAMLDSLVKLAA